MGKQGLVQAVDVVSARSGSPVPGGVVAEGHSKADEEESGAQMNQISQGLLPSLRSCESSFSVA